MIFSGRNCIFLLVVLVAGCIQLHHAQHFFGRCKCPQTIKMPRGNMSDFQVLEKRPGCDRTELIITLSGTTNSTGPKCIDTQTRMARAFLKCWERINKDDSRKTECINRKRRAEDRTSDE